jgi:site-specific recombinase XerD
MYREIFKYEWAIDRYLQAPHAADCERYLRARAEMGYSRRTLQKEASTLRRVIEELGDSPVVSLKQIDTVAKRRARKEYRRGEAQSDSSREYFAWLAKKWCQFTGCLEQPAQAPDPFSESIAEFAASLSTERGLSAHTVRSYCFHVRQFLNWYQTIHALAGISAVGLADIDTYLAHQGKRGWARTTISYSVSCLRSFFRHMGRIGNCSMSIAEGITGPRLYAQENLPMGPAWEDVRRLLANMGNERAGDVRDKAIIMLCAMYGFRRSEVVALRLDDIDWERNLISIWRPKQRCRQSYPLVPAMGAAIIQYLTEARPKSERRELFLMLTAPWGPITGSMVTTVVRTRLKAAGIQTAHLGPHALRHACATYLINGGFSLKEIADHLGHTTLASTRTYAKVDLPALREVAAIDLGGVL